MTGAGIALGSSSGSWEKVVGTILVGTGGIILANPISQAYAKEEALEESKKRLITLHQNIATLTCQLDSALAEHEADIIDNETLRRVITIALQNLATSSSQIQEIIGSTLDSAALVQTARHLRGRKAALDSFKTKALQSGNPLAAEAIGDVQTVLGDVANRIGILVEVESIHVPCPYCSELNETEIGKAPGSTIIYRCSGCLERFHIHRRFDGRVDTTKQSAIADVKCTNCGDVHGIKLRPDSASPIARWCLKCYVKQRIDPAKGIVTSFVPDTPIEVELTGTDASGRSICECPDCRNQLRAFAIRDGYVFAACYRCDNLLRIRTPESLSSNP